MGHIVCQLLTYRLTTSCYVGQVIRDIYWLTEKTWLQHCFSFWTMNPNPILHQ